MDTPQPTNITPTKQSNLSRYLLFGSIVIIAVVSVALAVALPKSSTEDRSKAASAGACIAQATVAGSSCNQKCGANEDCMSGMSCYKPSETPEGVCRNPSNPTSTTCSGTTTSPTPVTPTPTPIAACTKSCTYNYDCNLAANETCVGTNANNSAVNIAVTGTRAATSGELANLASDQIIDMTSGNSHVPDASGKMPFAVLSKTATTFFVNVYDIVGVNSSSLDPQKLILTKSFSIGANQVVSGTVTLPRCGRYQVDYGSSVVIGTKYDKNTVAHYFWGTVFEIPCQSGCCQLPTAAVPQSTTSKADLVRLALVDPSSGKGITGYTGLSASTAVTASTIPAYTVAAVSFPDALPAGIGSVKFEVNGQTLRIDSTESYTASDAALNLPAGTYTVKATLYSLENATGTVVDTLSTTITVTGTSTTTTGTTSTITFDDLSALEQPIPSSYPSGVANWGSNWSLSGPFGNFTTKSIYFSTDVTSKTFSFATAKKLVSVEVYNGGSTSSTVGISCAGNTTKTQTLAAGQKATMVTGFTTACTTVTLGSSNGWETNFDSIVYQ